MFDCYQDGCRGGWRREGGDGGVDCFYAESGGGGGDLKRGIFLGVWMIVGLEMGGDGWE